MTKSLFKAHLRHWIESEGNKLKLSSLSRDKHQALIMKLLGLISVILFSVLIAQHAVDGRKHGHHKRGKERVRSEAVEKIAAKVTPHTVQKATVADVGPVAQADNKTTAEKKVQ